MKIDLSGLTILITGASRGIGKAVSETLIQSGAHTIVHYNQNKRQVESLRELAPERVLTLQADLSNLDSCDQLFDDAVTKMGTIDVLVNNAGIAPMIPFDAEVGEWEQTWDHLFAVNLKSAAWLSRKAIRHFQSNGGGRIINIASRAAFRGDTADLMAYAATKGGMVAYTRSIARSFGKDGIKAFVVAPGFTRTDMATESIEEYGEDHVIADLALNRLTEPTDIAPMIALLASGLADHATGATIDINAGSYVH